jgi:membrane-associated phospholipid phosphatase
VLHWLAERASDAINPIFIALILEEPLLNDRAPGESLRRGLRFWLRAVLCISVAVVLAEAGKKYQVWNGHPNFPSGHTTFATSAAASLVLQRGRRWFWLVVPLAVLMGISLAYAGWHTPDEVLAGWVLGAIVPPLLWKLIGRSGIPAAQPTTPPR